ncbi:MAG: hypothetical protein WDO12_02580 [Pseudomonadota bacterium]
MSQHHVADERLLALASGRLIEGAALVVSVHLEACSECRARLHTLQAVGGAVLDGAAPVPLAKDALAQAMARIEAGAPCHAATCARPALRLLHPGPRRCSGPRACAAVASSDWRWMAPGMRFSRINLPEAPQASLFLLRIGAGRSLAAPWPSRRRTHAGAVRQLR